MPNTEPHVMGVINLRGDVLPLLGLAGKLGLKAPEINGRGGIIVVEANEEVIGLLVDAVSNNIAPSDEDMKPPPEAAKRGDVSYVSALTSVEDKLTRILDISELFSDSEPALAEVC